MAFSRADPKIEHAKVRWNQVHLEDEATIASAAAAAKAHCGELDLAIVATGILHDGTALHPEKTWRSLNAETLARAFHVNAIGPALVAKHFLPLLTRERKSIFAALSARVGSIEDNQLGGWYAYRASKAALNSMVRSLSIELARRNAHAVCVTLHPGTVDTALSKPFQRGTSVQTLFTPHDSATKLLSVMDSLTVSDSGQFFAWDGSRIPF